MKKIKRRVIPLVVILLGALRTVQASEGPRPLAAQLSFFSSEILEHNWVPESLEEAKAMILGYNDQLKEYAEDLRSLEHERLVVAPQEREFQQLLSDARAHLRVSLESADPSKLTVELLAELAVDPQVKKNNKYPCVDCFDRLRTLSRTDLIAWNFAHFQQGYLTYQQLDEELARWDGRAESF